MNNIQRAIERQAKMGAAGSAAAFKKLTRTVINGAGQKELVINPGIRTTDTVRFLDVTARMEREAVRAEKVQVTGVDLVIGQPNEDERRQLIELGKNPKAVALAEALTDMMAGKDGG